MKKLNLKKYLLLLLMLTVTKNVSAAATINYQKCEYTKEYTNWLKLSEAEKKKTLMPTVCKNNGTDKFYFAEANSKLSGVTINDEKFNLKDYDLVTSIKDQKNTLSCWAFASNAAIESNLLVKGIGTFDLSEAHLELATQNKYDKYRNSFNRDKTTGGNYSVSSAYLMNLWGPVNESALTFDRMLKSYEGESHIYVNEIISNNAMIDVNSIAFLGNNEGVCDSNIKKDIKEYLITNGAIATYLYLDGANKTKSHLYYNGDEIVNHAVTIVGWDDTVSKDSFEGDSKPSNDGAWIIKNSYGGEEYQYVSYEDVNVCNNVVGFFDTETEVEDNAYYYDNLGVNTTFKVSDKTMYFVSIFNKKSLVKEENLKEVAMYFSKINQKYEIYFANGEVKDITKAKKIGEGTSNFVGYKTIKLKTPEAITNDKFSIIVKLSDENELEYGVSSKLNENKNYDTMRFTEGVQFISNDGSNYTDVTKNQTPYQLSIRAYTDNGNVITSSNNNNQNNQNNFNANTEGNLNNTNVTSDNIVDTPTNSPQTGYYMPFALIVSLIGITLFVKRNKVKKLFKI